MGAYEVGLMVYTCESTQAVRVYRRVPEFHNPKSIAAPHLPGWFGGLYRASVV